MITDLGRVRRRWECPRCDTVMVTTPRDKGMPMHDCPGAGGLSLLMIPAGTRAKTTLVEREDYVGSEVVTYADGRPVMASVTETDEGEHRAVYAPCAVGGARVSQ